MFLSPHHSLGATRTEIYLRSPTHPTLRATEFQLPGHANLQKVHSTAAEQTNFPFGSLSVSHLQRHEPEPRQLSRVIATLQTLSRSPDTPCKSQTPSCSTNGSNPFTGLATFLWALSSTCRKARWRGQTPFQSGPHTLAAVRIFFVVYILVVGVVQSCSNTRLEGVSQFCFQVCSNTRHTSKHGHSRHLGTSLESLAQS